MPVEMSRGRLAGDYSYTGVRADSRCNQNVPVLALGVLSKVPFLCNHRGLKTLSLPATALPHANADIDGIWNFIDAVSFHYCAIVVPQCMVTRNAFGYETSYSDCGVSAHSITIGRSEFFGKKETCQNH